MVGKAIAPRRKANKERDIADEMLDNEEERGNRIGPRGGAIFVDVADISSRLQAVDVGILRGWQEKGHEEYADGVDKTSPISHPSRSAQSSIEDTLSAGDMCPRCATRMGWGGVYVTPKV